MRRETRNVVLVMLDSTALWSVHTQWVARCKIPSHCGSQHHSCAVMAEVVSPSLTVEPATRPQVVLLVVVCRMVKVPSPSRGSVVVLSRVACSVAAKVNPISVLVPQ